MPEPTAADVGALIDGLAIWITTRDIKTDKPGDAETLQQIGIGSGVLDTSVRKWLNNRFRKPNKWPLLIVGDLTIDMSWSAFKTKVLTYEPPKKTAKAKPIAASAEGDA